VHKKITKVGAKRWHILRGGEPCQSLLVYKNSQGTHTGDKNVNSEVEFQSINQVRFVEVPLADIVFICLNPVVISGKENTFSLTTILWLNNESFGLSFIKLLFEPFMIPWKQPCFRKELKVLWKILLH
jgi:hypothetical protein